MRTYGREGTGAWVEVQTDSNGYNDIVMAVTLIQVLKLNLGESPFYADYGIPARESVVQQIFPDYNVALTQQRFASNFAVLLIARAASYPPTYTVNITTTQGVKLSDTVEIPQ